MEIFKLLNAGEYEYETFEFCDKSLLRKFLVDFPLHQGESLIDVWDSNIGLKLTQGSEKADKPNFLLPMINDKSKELLFELIKSEVEFLPLHLNSEKYYVLNILNVLNIEECLDLEKSKIERFPSGNVKEITHIIFNEDKCLYNHIFTINELRGSQMFISNEFKEIIETNQLKNFTIIEL